MIGWRAFVGAIALLACAGAVTAEAQTRSATADRAYRLSVSAAPDNLRFAWDIDQGHFLFRNKFRFRRDRPMSQLAKNLTNMGEG